MKRSDPPIIVEEYFDADPASVWAAITDVEQMRIWFFENIPNFKPVVGFSVEFDVDAGERIFLHQWAITKVVPGKLISYNWRYGGYAGDAIVTFEVIPVNGSTMLRLTNIVTEDFQEGIPEFERQSCIGGWTYFIKQRLKEYLAKQA
jgi:uncharacterized protein YndB with AHSA1/START domain